MRTGFFVGPTAVGKTAIGIAIAQQLGAEIVSADSMQVYRGMNIGTAKPTEAERGGVPHHLIDVVDITEAFDVAQYRRMATTAIADIHRRGKPALVVGGTGLYIRALLRGLDELPHDDELRARLENEPLDRLVGRLRALDPLAAGKIDLQNKRRVTRALEVFELTGRSIVAQQAAWGVKQARGEGEGGRTDDPEPVGDAHHPSTHSPVHPFILLGLTRHRDDLYHRCDARVEVMFAHGLLDEVRGLLTRGLEGNQTAMQAVGYKEVVSHLRGEIPLTDCVAAVKIATRHLAKRQLTWFRRETNLRWIELGENETVEKTAQRVLETINQS